MAELKPALFARIDPTIKTAMESTAARLGLSAATYLANIIQRAVVQDAEKVSLSNAKHDDEIARLSASANDLIRLAHRIDGKQASR